MSLRSYGDKGASELFVLTLASLDIEDIEKGDYEDILRDVKSIYSKVLSSAEKNPHDDGSATFKAHKRQMEKLTEKIRLASGRKWLMDKYQDAKECYGLLFQLAQLERRLFGEEED